MVVAVRVLSMGPIDLFQNCSYSTGVGTKTKIKKHRQYVYIYIYMNVQSTGGPVWHSFWTLLKTKLNVRFEAE